MIIEIQSFVDLITNSSTECFIVCDGNTVNNVYALLSTVSNDTLENIKDRFEISLVKPDIISSYDWYLLCAFKDIDGLMGDNTYDDRVKIAYDYYEKNKHDYPDVQSKDEFIAEWEKTHYGQTCVMLSVECKNPEDEKIVTIINNLFRNINTGYTYD